MSINTSLALRPAIPGVSFGFGLLGTSLGPTIDPRMPPGRQPHPIGAGPIGAVGGAIAPPGGPDWGRHPMNPMSGTMQLQQQLHPGVPQQLPQQQLQQQQFQPKAVGCTPLTADAFHPPAPEPALAPLKAPELPREPPPFREVHEEPLPVREEQPRAERKPSGEKYVPPPAKRLSQGEKEKDAPVATAQKQPEKSEKHEKRFESAAIERRRVSWGPRDR